MKKIFKPLLIIINIILSLTFIYNFLTFNYRIWNWLFFTSIILSIVSQIIYLHKFKIGKRILFMLLMILLAIVSSLIVFLIPGYMFPYTEAENISPFSLLVGFSLTFINITIFYPILTLFINNLRKKEKNKKSYFTLIALYTIIITVIETIIMIFSNK